MVSIDQSEATHLPTLDQVELGALLEGVGGVSVDEAQAIATGPLLGLALLAVPVLVTTEIKKQLMSFSFCHKLCLSVIQCYL